MTDQFNLRCTGLGLAEGVPCASEAEVLETIAALPGPALRSGEMLVHDRETGQDEDARDFLARAR